MLSRIREVPGHTFFADDLELVLGNGHLAPERMVSYRLVTDAHLLAIARRHGARLATLDRGVEAMAGDNARDVVYVPAAGR